MQKPLHGTLPLGGPPPGTEQRGDTHVSPHMNPSLSPVFFFCLSRRRARRKEQASTTWHKYNVWLNPATSGGRTRPPTGLVVGEVEDLKRPEW